MMSSAEDVLKHEYAINQQWAVMKMIQSTESDPTLAYIHGFDAGIDLPCAKAKLSSPAIAEDIRKLADKLAEETAETMGSMLGENKAALISLSRYGK